jgi:hypothetical protein
MTDDSGKTEVKPKTRKDEVERTPEELVELRKNPTETLDDFGMPDGTGESVSRGIPSTELRAGGEEHEPEAEECENPVPYEYRQKTRFAIYGGTTRKRLATVYSHKGYTQINRETLANILLDFDPETLYIDSVVWCDYDEVVVYVNGWRMT